MNSTAEDSGNLNSNAKPSSALEHVVVWGKDQSAIEPSPNPKSLLIEQDMIAINAVTTEDLLKFEPSLVIRRRFIGDANGTLGIRGANMFQTSRSMVFADGVPLHYFLQSRWNGAPRWTMVSASEIAQVEVIYGPFSAEYSGNAMGGVVLIETAIPQQQEFHGDLSLFSQDFASYGFNDQLAGQKGFLSYGNKSGDLSYYFSLNRLDSKAQPQTYYYGSPVTNSSEPATEITGLVSGYDALATNGEPQTRWFFGDTGVVDTTTNNYKIKLGYDLGEWSGLLNVAYEDRKSSNNPTSYIRTQNGDSVWGGTVSQGDLTLSIPPSRLNISVLDRDSLSLGLRLRGDIAAKTSLEANINQFKILKDETSSSLTNPAYNGHTNAGQIADIGDSGWQAAELKLRSQDTVVDGLNVVTGIRYENYELNTNIYESNQYQTAAKTNLISSSGGKTDISALYLQLSWQLKSHFDINLGGRYEVFHSKEGYYTSDDNNTPQLDLITTPDISDKQFSPKFSIGYQNNKLLKVRYSLARAYRFPIVEELFSQYQAYNTISEANPKLKPEQGLHHNLSFDYELNDGNLTVNLFSETVKHVIESQSETITSGPNTGVSVRTFVPIDEVETQGIELVANQDNMFVPKLNVRFNLTWTDSEIVENKPDPSLEEKRFPRTPRWRANLLATYFLTERWDISSNLQYATKSYSRLDNKDEIRKVYGAQDGYTRIGLKSTYQLSDEFKLGFGIDNITNQISYVAHPWPSRTLYMNISYDL